MVSAVCYTSVTAPPSPPRTWYMVHKHLLLGLWHSWITAVASDQLVYPHLLGALLHSVCCSQSDTFFFQNVEVSGFHVNMSPFKSLVLPTPRGSLPGSWRLSGGLSSLLPPSAYPAPGSPVLPLCSWCPLLLEDLCTRCSHHLLFPCGPQFNCHFSDFQTCQWPHSWHGQRHVYLHCRV